MTDSETRILLAKLERPYHFLSPFPGEEFAIMIWVVDPTVSIEEQTSLSRQIIAQKCRFAVCAGHNCSTWDDSIDMAFMETDPNFQPSAERFVMTTWHEGESIDDIAEFFALNTSFSDFVAKNFLVLFIGTNMEMEQQAIKTVKSILDTRAV